MPEKGKKSLPINEDAHTKLKTLAAQRKLSLLQLIDELAEIAGALPPTTGAAVPAAARADSRTWHDMLERILTRGTERQVLGIQSNLEAFDANLPAFKPRRKAG